MGVMDESDVYAGRLDQEVVSLFLDDTPVRIRELRLAYEAGNTDSVRKLAHYLKGSAMYINARQMSALCAEVQHLAGVGDQPALGEALTRLEHESTRVSCQLQQIQETSL